MASLHHSATAPSGPGHPQCRGCTITIRHSTVGRNSLDEWTAWRRDLYLTTNNTYNRQTDIHALGRIRTCNPIKRSVANPRLWPRGLWDRPVMDLWHRICWYFTYRATVYCSVDHSMNRRNLDLTRPTVFTVAVDKKDKETPNLLKTVTETSRLCYLCSRSTLVLNHTIFDARNWMCVQW
jgi:hypothetical protein